MCTLTRVNLKQRLTSMWDSDVMLGNFSSPTVIESRESSVEEREVVTSRISLKCNDRSWGDCLTLGAAVLGLLGVVQLHLVVSSRHVHSNTQRL